MQVKRLLVTIHVWMGITIGALWALQGLSGAILVFNRDIQPMMLSGKTESGPVLPLDEIFARAGNAAGAKISQVENFGPYETLLVAYYKDAEDRPQTLIVDSRSGDVLDRRDPETMVPSGGASWRWLLRYHETMLAGDTGLLFVGASGILLLSSLLAGLYLAWPRRGAWRRAFNVRGWRTTMQRLFGWHRMLGLTAAAALLVMVPCGIYLAFAPTLRPLLIEKAGFLPPFKAKPVETLPTPAISAQQALDVARTRYPDAVLVRAMLPTKKSPVFTFRLLQAGETRRWAGTTTVAVDPVSGDIVDTYDPLTAPLANRLSDLVYPVHTGEVGGPFARLLVMLAGLTLPTLYVTGMLAWFRRRRRRAPALRKQVDAVRLGSDAA